MPRAVGADDVEYVKGIVRGHGVTAALGWDDALGEALLGLWRAALAFDERGGCSWKSYVYRRVTGELLDAARRNDHLTRNHRQALRGAATAAPPPPTYLEDLVAGDWWQVIAAATEEDIALRLVIDEAACAIEGRPGATLRLWMKGVPQTQIAEMLGVSKSLVCLVLHQALGEVRAALDATCSADLLEA